MLAACSSTLCACRTMSSPSGVTVTSLALRSNSLTSSSSSSFLMATDRVGCETKQASAALPKCRSRATATMYLSSVRVIACVNYAQHGSPAGISGLEVLGSASKPAVDVALRQLRVRLEHARRKLARPLQQTGVGGQVGKAKQRRAGLPRAEKLAGPADLQVAPGDLESVARFGHGAKPRARRLADP